MITLDRSNSQQQGTTPKGVQFLSPRHIASADKPQAATVTKVTTNKPDNFGNPVVVYFSMNGGKYSKGFKLSSDGLAQLVDVLGADENKWAKKSILIGKSVDDDGGERLTYSAAR